MNRRHVIVVVAFLCGAFSILGMSELADPSTALAREPIVPPAPPGKTVIVPVEPGKVFVGDVPKAIIDLQGQMLSLEGRVSTLQQALEKLQTQFANHHHVVEESVPPQPFRGAMYTTLNCPGIGQPCSLNSTSGSGGSTYGLYLFPPGSSPPNTPGPTVFNVTTSGPQD